MGETPYQQALAYIHSLYRFGSRPGLERVTALLHVLGNPHRDLQVVHVAGTNGKGSTVAMVSAVCEESGLRVGMYTSPYLESFNERIQVNGQNIPDGEVAGLVAEVRQAVDMVVRRGGEHPTEFEVVTALAFLYYARAGVDLVVLEVGLGGRYDATNVVQSPLVCVITNIGLDHTEHLGPDLGSIAYQKAGIIKRGARVVTGALEPEALAVIEQEARRQETGVIRVRPCSGGKGAGTVVAPGPERDGGDSESSVLWWVESSAETGQRLGVQGVRGRYDGLFIPLLGAHQAANAALAVAVVEELAQRGMDVDEPAIRRGLARVRWPGRLEVIGRKPLVLLDGAHNPDGVRVLRRTVEQLWPEGGFVVLVGVLRDKPVDDMLGDLLSVGKLFVVTRPPVSRGMPAVRLAALLENRGAAVEVAEEVASGVARALALAGPEGRVLVTGSLYLVGEVRRILRAETRSILDVTG